MRFEGEFKPPAIGTGTAPFPVAGAGSCTLADHALIVQGQAPARGGVLLALVGAAAAVGGALAVKTLLFPNMTPSTIAAVGAGGLVSGAMIPRKGRADRPVVHQIPWDRIKKVKVDPQQKTGAMIIVKGNKPKGAIHFVTADLRGFMAEVARRASVDVG